MARWDPWRGCNRISEGCRFCYIHKGDAKRGVITSEITKTARFNAPVERFKKGKRMGEYKMQPSGVVFLCFASDFLLPEADKWRDECWDMIFARQDLHFLFLTKRIERFMDCIPKNWSDGYDNVTVGVSVETQQRADERLSVFCSLPIKHKNIICQPMIEQIDISAYLNGVEFVVVGGESDKLARPLDYNWVLNIKEQCDAAFVPFAFRGCGTHFIKDGKMYRLNYHQEYSQAKKANINTGISPEQRITQ